MAVFRFSRLAERDLLGIAEYTLRTWGADQAVVYMDALEACCQSLADHPELGRACDDISPRLRRMEHGRHVVFYREKAGGILISRILHRRMLPDPDRIDDREDES